MEQKLEEFGIENPVPKKKEAPYKLKVANVYYLEDTKTKEVVDMAIAFKDDISAREEMVNAMAELEKSTE
jgi:hypothetical protein